MKLILLNGPPRSGKDTLGQGLIEHLTKQGYYAFHEKFSAPLKTSFAGMMKRPMFKDFIVGYWEDRKEHIVPGLGVSFRKWQQDMSERFMKPCYGQDIFGRLLHQRLIDKGVFDTNEKPAVAVITDCGFQVEVDYLLQHLTKADIIVFQIHRAGCTFEGDTRELVTNHKGETIGIVNNGTIEEGLNLLISEVDRWLNQYS